MDTDVFEVKQFDDIAKDRDKILQEIERYAAALRELQTLFARYRIYSSTIGTHTSFYTDGEPVNLDGIMKAVDSTLWEIAVNTSPLPKLLPSADVVKLKERLSNEAPAFSASDARAMVEKATERSGDVVMYTVKQVFNSLIQTKFRRGGGWNVKPRHDNARMVEESFRFSHFPSSCFEPYGRLKEEDVALFSDLERACRLLNNELSTSYPNRLGDVMAAEFLRHKTTDFATPYFKVKLFKNGNVKIDFLCKKTLETLNRWGADGKTVFAGF